MRIDESLKHFQELRAEYLRVSEISVSGGVVSGQATGSVSSSSAREQDFDGVDLNAFHLARQHLIDLLYNELKYHRRFLIIMPVGDDTNRRLRCVPVRFDRLPDRSAFDILNAHGVGLMNEKCSIDAEGRKTIVAMIYDAQRYLAELNRRLVGPGSITINAVADFFINGRFLWAIELLFPIASC